MVLVCERPTFQPFSEAKNEKRNTFVHFCQNQSTCAHRSRAMPQLRLHDDNCLIVLGSLVAEERARVRTNGRS